MKKMFFFLLLLPVTAIAQKNSSHNDDTCVHILNRSDTGHTYRNKRSDIVPVMNAGWINMEWLNKVGAMIYPNIEDMYKWDCEWNKAMKGTSIPY